MSDREALAAALEPRLVAPSLLPVYEAARRQLALTPETCGTCGGKTWVWSDERPNYGEQMDCPSCRGRGTVYPAETVEKIKATVREVVSTMKFGQLGESYIKAMSVAVLDALNTEPVLDRNTKGTW